MGIFLPGFRVAVLLNCSAVEETSKELPNFSIGVDLLGPDPTSSKNRAKKTRKLRVSQIFWKTSCSKFWPKDTHRARTLSMNKFSISLIIGFDVIWSYLSLN